ncbi:polygalacturonase inhibitor-like [Humulus lupulus]|uniref:polygalacturonase inhibitor-like n=1 Tax=Humulus lupulus TaxID=3486 RepID=UPI002B4040F5|nr:polygalacturonase inhibitor-like [Humulus lupulus]
MASVILSLLFFTTLLLHPALSELCNQNDKRVLLQIKKAFNDPYVLTSWHEDTDCCEWYCVECDSKTHRITSLSVIAGSLSGPIPPQVGDLPYLENLDLHKQVNLTGPIPPAIAKLKRLKSLRLDWTSLSGSVPGFLSQLTSLTSLDLSFNKLAGPIPASLSKLPKLNYLRLDRNKLTGPIPDSFGEFKGARFYLVLSHNQLSGKIPASLGIKKDFANIDLSWNKLEGDPKALFGSDKKVEYVDLSRNLLEFDMSKVDFPKSLTWLDVNHNKITGSLPVGLTALNDLQFLNVTYNRLCGKIPVGGKLQRFEGTSYFHNLCLCGAPLQRCK